MDWVDAILLVVAGVLAIAHITTQASKWSSSGRKFRLPPGPTAWPVLGNLSIFADPRPHARLEELANKFGPVMSIRMGSNLAVVVSSADMAREVMKVQDNNFASRPDLTAFHDLVFLEGTCGFQPLGPRHQYVRKIMVTELLTPKRTQRFEGSRRQELDAAMRSILHKSGQEIDIHNLGVTLTMNNMTRMLMSKRFCEFEAGEQIGEESSMADPQEAAEYGSLISEINRLLGIPVMGDSIPFLRFLDTSTVRSMQNSRSRLNNLLSKIIDNHRQRMSQSSTSSQHDFLEVLLNIPEEKGVDKDLTIKGILTDLVLAGVDTSAVAAEWAMSELLRNPSVLKKAQQELDSIVGKDRKLVESDVANLPYIQAIVKETLRLHPVAPLLIPHYSMQDCTLGDYDIPANTIVFISLRNLHRSPEAWDNPLQFRPERFIERDIDVKGQNFNLIPFGSGRRICPASALGWTVASTLVAKLIHSFDWCLPQGQRPEDLDMSEIFGLTVPRKHHLKVVPTPRLPLHLY